MMRLAAPDAPARSAEGTALAWSRRSLHAPVSSSDELESLLEGADCFLALEALAARAAALEALASLPGFAACLPLRPAPAVVGASRQLFGLSGFCQRRLSSCPRLPQKSQVVGQL
jgi:hypothetical protein